MKKTHFRATLAIALGLALAACGGGGGGGGNPGLAALALAPTVATPAAPPTAPATASQGDTIVPSSTVAGRCAAPRTGTDNGTGKLYPDRAGTLDDEKRWVRGWIDETYLWYDEVPGGLRADSYATPVAYFNVLKSPATTASGRAKDRYHFTEVSATYAQLSVGVSAGYGMELAFLSATRPRDVRVAFVEPGSPAAAAGIGRGMKLLQIDGEDVIDGSDADKLNAGLAPAKTGEPHSFTLGLLDGSTRTLTISSAIVTSSSVRNVKTFDVAGGGRLGYFQFNDHNTPAEAQLVTAVGQLQSSGITGLVIDMRYNGGGLLAVASELAYMVATPQATLGTTFERLQFSAKNPFNLTPGQTNLPFYATTQGFSTGPGQALPQLGLSSVTVLTGPDTCSASESVVNSLRGVGIGVRLVGGRTCGKPYGFVPQDNCGTTYFAIQFQGVNQQGFGDYGDGFAPDCALADDFSHALGDPAERLLAAALSGTCPSTGAAKPGSDRQKAEMGRDPLLLLRPPARQNRLVGW